MSSNSFSLDALGFQDESERCYLRFSRRTNGALRCRLVLNEECSEIVRGWGNTLTAHVNEYGDVLLTHGKSLTILGDICAWISLDRHAPALYECSDEAPYDSTMFCGGNKILLVRSRDA